MKYRDLLLRVFATSFMMLTFLMSLSSFTHAADPLDSWNPRTSGTTDNLHGVTYANGTFVAVGYRTILTSPDGITWTARSMGPTCSTCWLRGVAYGNGSFVAVGHEGVILTSPDGITWTDRSLGYGSFRAVTFTDGTFFAAGMGGLLLSSPAGDIWSPVPTGTTDELRGISDTVLGVDCWRSAAIAVGQNGTLLNACNKWATEPSGTTADINGVVGTQTCSGAYIWPRHIAVGNAGTIQQDVLIGAAPWTPMMSGTNKNLYGIASYCNRYIAVGDGGTILTHATFSNSTPEQQAKIPWVSRKSGTNSILFAVTYGKSTLVIVGEKGTILQSDPITNVDTPVGSNITVTPPGIGIYITFANVTAKGTTSVTTGSSGPSLSTNFQVGNPPTYYHVSTTAAYTPPVKVCITYDPAQYSDPSKAALLHYDNGAWVDITTSNDPASRIVCGQVTGLSPFIVAQKLTAPKLMWIKGTVATFTSKHGHSNLVGIKTKRGTRFVRFCDPTNGIDRVLNVDNVQYDLLKMAHAKGNSVQVGVYDFGKDPQSGIEKLCIDQVISDVRTPGKSEQ